MSARSERTFTDLNTQEDLESLIGKPEDGDFECKMWAGLSEKSRGQIAKAACGFTNATGGVIVIGLKTSRGTADTADVVEELVPVSDRQTVSAAALDIILKHVVPGISGIQIKDISHNSSAREGYVVIHVPETEASPQRTNIQKEFYVRVATGTIPMEYFQIADRFGRRPHPKLVVELSPERIEIPVSITRQLQRTFQLSVRNEGRGIARFPCLRHHSVSTFQVINHPYHSQNPPWKVYQLADWTSIRGGADDVIYPGETFVVATMGQNGQPNVQNPNAWDYPAAVLEVELLCDDMPPHRQTLRFEATTWRH